MEYETIVKKSLNESASNPESAEIRKKSVDSIMSAIEAAYQQGENAGYAQGVRDGALQSSPHIAEAFTKGMESGLSIKIKPEAEE